MAERFMVIKKWWSDNKIACRLCGIRTDKYRVVFDETGMNVEYYCKPCFDKHLPRKINTGCIVGCDNCNPITNRTRMDCADGICRCPDCWREWKVADSEQKEKKYLRDDDGFEKCSEICKCESCMQKKIDAMNEI